LGLAAILAASVSGCGPRSLPPSIDRAPTVVKKANQHAVLEKFDPKRHKVNTPALEKLAELARNPPPNCTVQVLYMEGATSGIVHLKQVHYSPKIWDEILRPKKKLNWLELSTAKTNAARILHYIGTCQQELDSIVGHLTKNHGVTEIFDEGVTDELLPFFSDREYMHGRQTLVYMLMDKMLGKNTLEKKTHIEAGERLLATVKKYSMRGYSLQHVVDMVLKNMPDDTKKVYGALEKTSVREYIISRVRKAKKTPDEDPGSYNTEEEYVARVRSCGKFTEDCINLHMMRIISGWPRDKNLDAQEWMDRMEAKLAVLRKDVLLYVPGAVLDHAIDGTITIKAAEDTKAQDESFKSRWHMYDGRENGTLKQMSGEGLVKFINYGSNHDYRNNIILYSRTAENPRLFLINIIPKSAKKDEGKK